MIGARTTLFLRASLWLFLISLMSPTTLADVDERDCIELVCIGMSVEEFLGQNPIIDDNYLFYRLIDFLPGGKSEAWNDKSFDLRGLEDSELDYLQTFYKPWPYGKRQKNKKALRILSKAKFCSNYDFSVVYNATQEQRNFVTFLQLDEADVPRIVQMTSLYITTNADEKLAKERDLEQKYGDNNIIHENTLHDYLQVETELPNILLCKSLKDTACITVYHRKLYEILDLRTKGSFALSPVPRFGAIDRHLNSFSYCD